MAFATSPAFGIGIVPAVIREFRERFPSIRLRCVDGLYPGTLAGLRDRALDFAIGPCDLDHLEPLFVAEPLLPGNVVIVCRREYPSRAAGALAELSECEGAISSGPGGVGAFIEQAFRAFGAGRPQGRHDLRIVHGLARSDCHERRAGYPAAHRP